MTEWVTGFVLPQIAEVHKAFARDIETAVQLEVAARGTPLARAAAAALAERRIAFAQFNDGLRQAAQAAAVEAERGILDRLQATQVRADTGATPHLRDVISCRPIGAVGLVETGAVGVADVSELDRAINPRGNYGPYWRAQEYGTGGTGGNAGVPSQVGRIIFGYFALAGGGDPTPPQAQYAGGGGPHPVFLSTAGGQLQFPGLGPGSRGGRGGIGTISHEIKARHFIGLGKDNAAIRWRSQIDVLQQQAIGRLAAIGAA